MTVKTLRQFMKDIPNEAQVVFSEKIITFLYNGNAIALNTYGATWDNGIGYDADGITVCGECTHFDCAKCKELKQEF